MFSTPLPRTSFLDSRLRSRGRQNRLLERGLVSTDSHLATSPRDNRPVAPLQARPDATETRQRHTA